MSSYRRAWRGSWSLVAALGVGLAVLEWSAITVLVIVALITLAVQAARRLVPSTGASLLRDLTFPHALGIAVAAVAVWSVSLVSFPLALLAVMVAGLTSPAVIQRLRRARHRVSSGTTPVPESGDAVRLTPPETLGPLVGLDDRQLCRLWRESFWALGSAAPTQTLLCVVALREACLDELERRHAAELGAWLANGARASGGPEKYLRPGHGGSDAA